MLKEKNNIKILFYVKECRDYPIGEYHGGITSAIEAIELFNRIPPERMNGIPVLGISVIDNNDKDIAEIDFVSRKTIDIDMLNYIPQQIIENEEVQNEIAKIIYGFPNAKIVGIVPKNIDKKYKQLLEG